MSTVSLFYRQKIKLVKDKQLFQKITFKSKKIIFCIGIYVTHSIQSDVTFIPSIFRSYNAASNIKFASLFRPLLVPNVRLSLLTVVRSSHRRDVIASNYEVIIHRHDVITSIYDVIRHLRGTITYIHDVIIHRREVIASIYDVITQRLSI